MPISKIKWWILLALLIKLSLFGYACIGVPQSKFLIDSELYLQTSQSIAEKLSFGVIQENGVVSPDYYRTPGYPLFLAIFLHWLNLPLAAIVFLQIILTLGAAGIVYAAAGEIDRELAPLALIFMLFEPSITIFSLMVLTESLFLFLLAAFFYSFIRYLKSSSLKTLLLAGVYLIALTYVRPIAFYLPLGCAVFCMIRLWNNNPRRIIKHIIIFLLIIHAGLGLWQIRNYKVFQKGVFSNIANATLKSVGLFAGGDGAQSKNYLLIIGQAAVGVGKLYTQPASLKYFQNDGLKKAGKLLAYPWVGIWLIGFLIGITQIKQNIYPPSQKSMLKDYLDDKSKYASADVRPSLERADKPGEAKHESNPAETGYSNVGLHLQFALWMVLYFTAATLVGNVEDLNARFFIPLTPFVAVLSAHGWRWMLTLKGK